MSPQTDYIGINSTHQEWQVLGFCCIGGGCLFGFLGFLLSEIFPMIGLPIILSLFGCGSLVISRITGNRQLTDEHKAILADYISESQHAQQYVQLNGVTLMNYRSFESAKEDIERLVIQDKAVRLSRASR